MMTKKQKSVSFPWETWQETEETYQKYIEELKTMEITSPSELLRVLVNLGKPRLPEIIEAIRKSRKRIEGTQPKP